MSGSPRMSAEHIEHRSDGAVVRNRIGNRQDRPEAEASVRVRAQVATRLVILQLRPLHIVETLIVGLPDGKLGPGHAGVTQAAHGSAHETWLSARSVRD